MPLEKSLPAADTGAGRVVKLGAPRGPSQCTHLQPLAGRGDFVDATDRHDDTLGASLGGLLEQVGQLRSQVELGSDVDRYQLKDLWPEIQRVLVVSEQLLGVLRAGETGYLAVSTERLLVLAHSIARGGELRGAIAFEDIARAQVERGSKRKHWNLALTMRDGTTKRLVGLRQKDEQLLRPWLVVGRALGLQDPARRAA